MNLQGVFQGIPWNAFDRQRPGHRREFCLKFKGASGWRQLWAPREVTSEIKFRKWAVARLGEIVEMGEEPKRRRGDEGTSVEPLYERWILLRELDDELAGITVDGDRSKFRVHILPRWGSIQVSHLETREGRLALREWARELRQKLSSAVAVRGVVSTFAKFCEDVNLEGWVTLRSNPLRSAEVKGVLPSDEERRKVVAPPPDAIQALVTCRRVELRRRVRYAVAACTGANNGELSGAKVSSLRALRGDSPRLEITQAFKLRGGKLGPGGGPRKSVIGPTKNKYRVRAIPLNECARAALIEWLDGGWETLVGRPPEPGDPLFPNTTGKHSWPAMPMRKDLELAELPTHDGDGRPYEFRSLRRAFATMLRAQGVDRESRERLMGQSSDSVNSEHYTGEVPATLLEAVRKIPLTWSYSSDLGDAVVARLGGSEQDLACLMPNRSENVSFGQASTGSAYSGNVGGLGVCAAGPESLLVEDWGAATKDKHPEAVELAGAIGEHRAQVEASRLLAERSGRRAGNGGAEAFRAKAAAWFRRAA